jgi:hypothetical protein
MEILRIKFYPIQTTDIEIAVKFSWSAQPIISKLIISERHAVDKVYAEFTKIAHDIWKITLHTYLYLEVKYGSLRWTLGRSSLCDKGMKDIM